MKASDDAHIVVKREVCIMFVVVGSCFLVAVCGGGLSIKVEENEELLNYYHHHAAGLFILV